MQRFEMNQLYLITTVLVSLILGANAFSYKEAKNWGKQYPECNGKNQSPITIVDDVHRFFSPTSNETLKLTNFKKMPKKLTITNTGHTVEIKADWSGKPPMCTGGPLHGNYVFEKIVFHWAQKSWAEETFANSEVQDSMKKDVELQMFFYRTDLKSFKEAETKKSGLAIFKLRLKSQFGDPDHRLDNLEKNLHKVQSPNSSAEIPPFRLTSYYGDQIGLMLYYNGSLDYPPCSESVSWFLDWNAYFASKGLVNGFRKIKLAEGDVSNVRPVQPLNKRELLWVDYDIGRNQ